jgi:hypothetical protein
MIYEHNKYEANSSNINTAFSCYSGWLNAPGSGGIHPSLYGWFMAEIAMLLSKPYGERPMIAQHVGFN